MAFNIFGFNCSNYIRKMMLDMFYTLSKIVSKKLVLKFVMFITNTINDCIHLSQNLFIYRVWTVIIFVIVRRTTSNVFV